MRLSVIVPHLNQHDQLAECLVSLHQDIARSNATEIIVVDNGSEPLPTTECAAWRDVRLVVETTPGPGPARNRGVSEAMDPDVVAFVDADCTVDSNWIAAITDAFDDEHVDIIGGDIRVRFRDASAPEPIELYESIYSYRNELHIAEGFSGTGNLATRLRVFCEIGPFGGKDIAEDREWGLRSREAGFRIVYVPEMIVYHPARRSFAELRLKWDRHVAHDLLHYAEGQFGRVRWFGRAIAVAGSPLAEIGTVRKTSQLFGARQRLLAFAYLCLVRWYRSLAMVRIAITDAAGPTSRSWNV